MDYHDLSNQSIGNPQQHLGIYKKIPVCSHVPSPFPVTDMNGFADVQNEMYPRNAYHLLVVSNPLNMYLVASSNVRY